MRDETSLLLSGLVTYYNLWNIILILNVSFVFTFNKMKLVGKSEKEDD